MFQKMKRYIRRLFFLITRLLSRGIGWSLIFTGSILSLLVLSLYLGIVFTDTRTSLLNWLHVLIKPQFNIVLFEVGTFVTFITPLLMLIYNGVKWAFNLTFKNRFIHLISGCIWLSGFAATGYVTIGTARDFGKVGKCREPFHVIQNDTLYLVNKPVSNDLIKQNFWLESNDNQYRIIDSLRYYSILGKTKLTVIKSKTNQIELVVVKQAHGKDKSDANQKAKAITYYLNQIGNVMYLNDLFLISGNDQFRFQELSVILKLPLGKVVYFDKSMIHRLNHVQNVTSTSPNDMLNKKWIMTSEGLAMVKN